MNASEVELLQQYVDFQSQCDQLRIQCADVSQEIAEQIRVLSDEWRDSGPRSAVDNQWFSDTVKSIRSQVAEVVLTQHQINEQLLEHNLAVRQISSEMARDPDAEVPHLLTEMRDLARLRSRGGLPIVLGQLSEIREQVNVFRAKVENRNSTVMRRKSIFNLWKQK
jgi:hypothetical protein